MLWSSGPLMPLKLNGQVTNPRLLATESNIHSFNIDYPALTMANPKFTRVGTNHGLLTPPASPTRQHCQPHDWPAVSNSNDNDHLPLSKNLNCLESKEYSCNRLISTPPSSPTKPFCSSLNDEVLSNADVFVTNKEASCDDEDNIICSEYRTEILNYDGTNDRKHNSTDINVEHVSKESATVEAPKSVRRPYFPGESQKSAFRQRSEGKAPSTSIIDWPNGDSCTAPISSSGCASKGRVNEGLSPILIRKRSLLMTAQRKQNASSPKYSHISSDRYIPQRPDFNNCSAIFRVGKATKDLSDMEKVTRSHEASPDPFSAYVPRIVPLNHSRPKLLNPTLMQQRRVSPSGIGMLGLHQDAQTSQRQLSAGTVWNVGGPCPTTDSRIGVPNGRGGILKSGTNAPLYGNLFASLADATSINDAYERRIAVAAEVNQLSRVVLANKWSEKLEAFSTGSAMKNNGTAWIDNRWTHDKDPQRSLLDYIDFERY